MKLPFQPKLFLAAVASCVLLGLVFSYAFGLSFWWSVVIMALALLVNGLVAHVEDQSHKASGNAQGEHNTKSSETRSDA